ncbi:uncharacterized protein YdhG (YjbR/CyaY superfamily) [Catenulispora sp. MAP5-51]|uniref:iron chaperone n=1 Tax=Catenulispora sp. MAP5-51 TaxID=3156298 RepID=UPI0035163AFB
MANTTKKTTENFSAEERAAMKERAKEVRTSKKAATGADAEAEVLAKIEEFPPDDRELAEKVHAVVKAAAPALTPRLWYGQPAYSKDGKVLVFFQPASKFKTRYATLGFSDVAVLDDGEMWPTYYALTEMTDAVEKRIAELVARAAA